MSLCRQTKPFSWSSDDVFPQMSEWLDIMLEEIDRKKKEEQADREERNRRVKKSSTAKKRKSKKSIRSSE